MANNTGITDPFDGRKRRGGADTAVIDPFETPGPDMAERIRNFFPEPDRELDRVGRAFAHAEKYGLTPSQAYEYGDDLERQEKFDSSAVAIRNVMETQKLRGLSTLGISHPEQERAGETLRELHPVDRYPEPLQTLGQAMLDTIDILLGIPEAAGTYATGPVGFVGGTITGAGELLNILVGREEISPEDFEAAKQAQEQVMRALTYQPRTRFGQTAARVAASLSALKEEFINKYVPEGSRAMVSYLTDVLLAASPLARRTVKRLPQRIKGSTWYRRLTNREKALVALEYDDLVNRGYSEAELARMSDKYFREALERRQKPEDAAALKEAPYAKDIGKGLAKPLRETRVAVPKITFERLGVKEANVFADYAALYNKHPEYFKGPAEVQRHVEYVMEQPEYVLPATKPEYKLLVRRNGADRAAVVEFRLKGGKYRVRSAYILDEGQLERKIKKLSQRGVRISGPGEKSPEGEISSRSAAVPSDTGSAGPESILFTPDDEVNTKVVKAGPELGTEAVSYPVIPAEVAHDVVRGLLNKPEVIDTFIDEKPVGKNKAEYFLTDENSKNILSNAASTFLRLFGKYNTDNPIVGKFGHKVVFGPDARALKRLDIERAYIEYALHSLSSTKGGDYTTRHPDKGKIRSLALVKDIIEEADGYIERNDTVFYVKRLRDGKRPLGIVVLEISRAANGTFRYKSHLPERNESFLRKFGPLRTTPLPELPQGIQAGTAASGVDDSITSPASKSKRTTLATGAAPSPEITTGAAKKSSAISSLKETISNFYDTIFASKANKLRKLSLGQLSSRNIEIVRKETGMDLTGYSRAIDNYSIRHMMGKHGDPKFEAARGQIAITKEDIMMIPEIVASPDKVSSAEKSGIGRDVILYRKRVNGEIYYYEEVRTGRNEVVPVTMYKKKRAATSK